MKDSREQLSQIGENHAEPVKIWRARRFIERNFADQLSLKKVADAVGISATHLSEKFKEVTGSKFVDYVARTRFDNACDLLRRPELRVSEIAFAAGFQSLSQFNRVFRRLCGKSPSEYRVSLLKENPAHESIRMNDWPKKCVAGK